MKYLVTLPVLVMLFCVAAVTQTRPGHAAGTVLEIHRAAWGETASYAPCTDCWDLPDVTLNYRNANRHGRGNYGAWVVLKNRSSKPIKSVSLDFVFTDAATRQEFLRYHLLFDREVGPGHKKEVAHRIGKGKESENFSPAAPDEATLRRTRECEYAPLVRLAEKPTRPVVCTYEPVVTRIEYADGSVWKPL